MIESLKRWHLHRSKARDIVRDNAPCFIQNFSNQIFRSTEPSIPGTVP